MDVGNIVKIISINKETCEEERIGVVIAIENPVLRKRWILVSTEQGCVWCWPSELIII